MNPRALLILAVLGMALVACALTAPNPQPNKLPIKRGESWRLVVTSAAGIMAYDETYQLERFQIYPEVLDAKGKRIPSPEKPLQIGANSFGQFIGRYTEVGELRSEKYVGSIWYFELMKSNELSIKPDTSASTEGKNVTWIICDTQMTGFQTVYQMDAFKYSREEKGSVNSEKFGICTFSLVKRSN